MLRVVLIQLIRIYQRTISPLLGDVCRFEPSCSRYAVGCLELHGVFRGSWLALRRLMRCHPFNPGGYDPPPLPERIRESTAELPSSDETLHGSGAVDVRAIGAIEPVQRS